MFSFQETNIFKTRRECLLAELPSLLKVEQVMGTTSNMKIQWNPVNIRTQSRTQSLRSFWNTKAEELCRSSALKTFKSGEIQGAINVAWTIEKTGHLKNEMEKVNQEINDKCSLVILKKFQLSAKTLEKNRKRVETAEASVKDIQLELTSARQEYFDSTKSERRANSARVDELEKKLELHISHICHHF